MKKQVNKEKYEFNKYCDLERWASYWYQINEISNCQPESMLEIGVGNNIVANYIKNNTNIKYFSLDIAEDLEPDIIGSVDDIPLADNSYDLICAFEVLEHLPFDKFTKCLEELKRVSKKDILISLPHWGRHFSVKFRVPYFKTIKWQYKFNIFAIEHKYNGEHYWEIGKKGYDINKIKEEIEAVDLKIVRDYVVFESSYHHFFKLKKT